MNLKFPSPGKIDMSAPSVRFCKYLRATIEPQNRLNTSENRSKNEVITISSIATRVTNEGVSPRNLIGGRKMSEEINHERRRFIGTVATALAAAQFGMIDSAAAAQSSNANPATVRPIKPGTNTSFGSFKQIDAGLLNVGYAEAGPASGPPVVLLHGWPYDIYSYVDVALLLASAGYRVIVP